jgi:hypothetical protein
VRPECFGIQNVRYDIVVTLRRSAFFLNDLKFWRDFVILSQARSTTEAAATEVDMAATAVDTAVTEVDMAVTAADMEAAKSTAVDTAVMAVDMAAVTSTAEVADTESSANTAKSIATFWRVTLFGQRSHSDRFVIQDWLEEKLYFSLFSFRFWTTNKSFYCCKNPFLLSRFGLTFHFKVIVDWGCRLVARSHTFNGKKSSSVSFRDRLIIVKVIRKQKYQNQMLSLESANKLFTVCFIFIFLFACLALNKSH